MGSDSNGEAMHRCGLPSDRASPPDRREASSNTPRDSSRASRGLEGADRFEVVGTSAQLDALASEIGGPVSSLQLPTSARTLASKVGASPMGPYARRVAGWLRSARATLPSSPATVEQGGYDVVHFAAQAGERTSLPNLYQPWDLQHLHFPDLFSSGELARRDAVYGPCCDRATYVVVASQFVRSDVIASYGVDPAARRGRGSWAAPAAAGRATARRRHALRVVPRPDVGPQEPPPPHRRDRGLERAGHARARRVHGPTERARQSHTRSMRKSAA